MTDNVLLFKRSMTYYSHETTVLAERRIIMQEEKTIFPERTEAPETAVKEVLFILPTGETGIPLLNTIADTARLCAKFNVGLSEWHIRKLCNSGAIPFISFGSKRLINWNVLMRYVNSGGEFRVPPKSEREPGIIARIPEKLRA